MSIRGSGGGGGGDGRRAGCRAGVFPFPLFTGRGLRRAAVVVGVGDVGVVGGRGGVAGRWDLHGSGFSSPATEENLGVNGGSIGRREVNKMRKGVCESVLGR